ncbi:(Lyso)-N-acylphosphatidylethanolamine lipase-like isoform X2 [Gordionus sp. m RMFG-2023]|uniref:(Lyso)-N-acylphosphatidylethanolamine lipase-like isoform X2 n=1 Tax=Gordionus sp. m RMFG-2023 TaxID=3053472 RepID=UPI0031FCA901
MSNDINNGSFKIEATSKYWIASLYKWCPTSLYAIEKAENKILSYLKCNNERYQINIGPNINIWTLSCDHKDIQKTQSTNVQNVNEFENFYGKSNDDANNCHKNNSNNDISDPTPLVLIHGFAAGLAFWVYAFDILGFGKSTRVQFPCCPKEAENIFISSIEKWRLNMKITTMIILAHSFGAFLASAYALKYPDSIKHIILCDPWGFPEKPIDSNKVTNLPLWVKMMTSLFQPFNPLALLRMAGPWGPLLVEKTRPDLQKKFTNILGDDDTSIFEYVYHCNAQNPTGESAFSSMTIPWGWAKYPMIRRIPQLKKELPMTIIYGSRSWIDSGIGFQVKYLRPDSYVDVKIISGAGHHVYADKEKEFNHIINSICKKIDANQLLK